MKNTNKLEKVSIKELEKEFKELFQRMKRMEKVFYSKKKKGGYKK